MQMQVSHQSTPEDIKRYLTHLEEGGRSIPPQPVCCPCLELLAEHACGSEQRTAGWAAQPNVTSAPEGAYESTLGGTKNMRKRILASLMALILALSLLPTAALATGETQEPEQEAQIPVSENGTEGGGEDATIPVETGDETGTSDETETTVITTPTATPTETTPAVPNDVAGVETDVEITADTAELTSGTYYISANLEVTGALTVPAGADVTISLNGHTLTVQGSKAMTDDAITDDTGAAETRHTSIDNQGTLTVTGGTLALSCNDYGIWNTGTLTIEAGVKISSNNLYLIGNLGGTVETSGELTNTGGDGIVTYGGTVEVNGGKISAPATNMSCLTIFNRSYDNTGEGANVTIAGGELESNSYVASTNNLKSGGSNGSNLTITGGTLSSSRTTVYWPSSGTLTIGTLGSATGPVLTSTHGSAVEHCSGTLNIYGGTLSGGTEQNNPADRCPTENWLVGMWRTESGSANAGDAVSIIARRAAGYVTAPLSVNIMGGTLTSTQNYAVRYLDCNQASNAAQLTQDVEVRITGGDFSGSIAVVDAEFVAEVEQKFITGGTFSTDPSDYVAEGYAAFEGGDDSETVYVVKKPQYTETEEVRETVQAGKTDASVSNTIDGSDTDKATAAAESVAESASGNSVLAGAALSEAQAADKDTAITELAKKQLITIEADGTIAGDKTVSVVAQYYFNVTATAYAVDGSDATRNAITFDITPMYQLVATTADLEQGGSIVTDGGGKNAVPLGKPQVLEISEPITMTLDLPSGFFGSEQNPTTAYVTHFKASGAVYQYTASVTTKEGNNGYTITFKNPNGFSLMRVAATQDEAAIGEQTYPTLEDAIAAVASSSEKTITLLDDVTVRGQIKIDDAEVILNGNNHILSAAEGTKIEDGGLIDITANNATVQNMTINTNGSAKYGVQFYNSTGGELIGVIINGGYYSSVNVNASEVDMTNCTLNPGTGSYATIDYSIGSAEGLDRIPAIKLNNVTTNNAGGLKIWADNATVERAQALLEPGDNVAAAIRDKIDTKNNDAVLVSIEVTEGGAPADITIPSTKPVIPVTPDDDDDTPSYSGGSSSSETSYSNTIDASDGGSVKVSPRTPSRGETVTITPTPDTGYEVDEVIVTDRNGDEVEVTANRNGTYTFEQPRGRVTIEVTFVRTGGTVGTAPFLDVAEDAWYAEAVAYVYDNGLMSGTSTTLFSPNATTTRGMIVTMLYRLEGEPRISSGSAFDDVDAGMYYADAVAWASQNDIVTGYDEATFGPNNAITREQMAAILYRYAQYKGYRTTAGADLSGYVDADSVSSYALASLQWANAAGLVTGTSSNTLTPDGSATRAQVATIFMRFMEDVAE